LYKSGVDIGVVTRRGKVLVIVGGNRGNVIWVIVLFPVGLVIVAVVTIVFAIVLAVEIVRACPLLVVICLIVLGGSCARSVVGIVDVVSSVVEKRLVCASSASRST